MLIPPFVKHVHNNLTASFAPQGVNNTSLRKRKKRKRERKRANIKKRKGNLKKRRKENEPKRKITQNMGGKGREEGRRRGVTENTD